MDETPTLFDSSWTDSPAVQAWKAKRKEQPEHSEALLPWYIPSNDKYPQGVLGGTRTSFSVTELEQYLRCPYGWFVRYVIKPPFTPSAAAQRGALAHNILAAAFAVEPEQRQEVVRLALEKKQMSAHEAEVLGSQIERIMQTYGGQEWPFSEHYCEFSINSVGLLPDLPYYQLTGRVDRIDVNDEELLVIDYKSGKINLPNDLQSYMYPLMAAQGFERTPVGAVYLSLSSCAHAGLLERSIEQLPQAQLGWREAAEKALHVVQEAICQIELGEFGRIGDCPSWCPHTTVPKEKLHLVF